MTSCMALDGVTSFFRLKDVTNTCKRMRRGLSIGGNSSVQSRNTRSLILVTNQSGRVVKAYEYYQTCIATKTFEFFGFLSEARNDTQNLTACCTNVPNLILLKIGHLCSSFVQVFP